MHFPDVPPTTPPPRSPHGDQTPLMDSLTQILVPITLMTERNLSIVTTHQPHLGFDGIIQGEGGSASLTGKTHHFGALISRVAMSGLGRLRMTSLSGNIFNNSHQSQNHQLLLDQGNCLSLRQRTHLGVLASGKSMSCNPIMFTEMRLPWIQCSDDIDWRIPLDDLNPDQEEGPSAPQVTLSWNPVHNIIDNVPWEGGAKLTYYLLSAAVQPSDGAGGNLPSVSNVREWHY